MPRNQDHLLFYSSFIAKSVKSAYFKQLDLWPLTFDLSCWGHWRHKLLGLCTHPPSLGSVVFLVLALLAEHFWPCKWHLTFWAADLWPQEVKCQVMQSRCLSKSYAKKSWSFTGLFRFYGKIWKSAYFDLIWPLTSDLWPTTLTAWEDQIRISMHPPTKFEVPVAYGLGGVGGTKFSTFYHSKITYDLVTSWPLTSYYRKVFKNFLWSLFYVSVKVS